MKPTLIEEDSILMKAESNLPSILSDARKTYPYPLAFRHWPERFTEAALGLLFPHFGDSLDTDPKRIGGEISEVHGLVIKAVEGLPRSLVNSADAANGFIASLSEIREALIKDAEAVFSSDPAAESLDQVIFCYPGFFAIAVYRLAHQLHQLDIPLLPRMLSEHAHRLVGIDIHPAATIGESFFIDHGTGIVVGGTAIIGNRVKLYQGVTLGALQVHKRLAGTRRHPTIEDDVVVYAHATILGDVVIGHDSIVGGNTWITQSVPPHSVVSIGKTVRRTADPTHNEVLDFSI